MSNVSELDGIANRIPLGVPSCVMIAPNAEESVDPCIVILVKFLIFALKLVTV